MGTCATDDTRIEVFDSGGCPLRIVDHLLLLLDVLAVLFHIVAAQSCLFIHCDDDIAVDMQVSPWRSTLTHSALKAFHDLLKRCPLLQANVKIILFEIILEHPGVLGFWGFGVLGTC